jgi:hypothetical protein
MLFQLKAHGASSLDTYASLDDFIHHTQQAIVQTRLLAPSLSGVAKETSDPKVAIRGDWAGKNGGSTVKKEFVGQVDSRTNAKLARTILSSPPHHREGNPLVTSGTEDVERKVEGIEISYEDITAEVEARLQAKATRAQLKEAVKRKRVSDGSLTDTKSEMSVAVVHKPRNKRKRTTESEWRENTGETQFSSPKRKRDTDEENDGGEDGRAVKKNLNALTRPFQ